MKKYEGVNSEMKVRWQKEINKEFEKSFKLFLWWIVPQCVSVRSSSIMWYTLYLVYNIKILSPIDTGIYF